MAKKINSQATSYKDYMGLPINIKRGNPVPLDTTAVWYDKAAMETYAKSGATAYVGQVLVLALADVTEAYVIKDEAGNLIKLATTTASGDLASDVAKLQSAIKLTVKEVVAGDKSVNVVMEDVKDSEGIVTGKKVTVKANISAEAGNSISLKEDGLFAVGAEYSIKKLETATSGMAASYQLTKDGTGVGAVIDIPKDLVVKSGDVQTFTDETAPTVDGKKLAAGTYIVLVLNNEAEDKLYIKADDLIEYVASGSGENDSVQVAVSADHKVTATIKDKSIELGKLAQGIQDSLGKADSALQAADITAVTGGTGKFKVGETEIEVASEKYIKDTVASDISTAKEAAITAAGENADTKIKTAIGTLPEGTANVKAYVDDSVSGVTTNVTNLDTRLTTAEGNITTLQSKKIGKDDLTDDFKTEVGTFATKAEVTTLDGELATIAKTGNVNDLVQTAGDVIVFDCN